jgi:hypothetical protein
MGMGMMVMMVMVMMVMMMMVMVIGINSKRAWCLFNGVSAGSYNRDVEGLVLISVKKMEMRPKWWVKNV